MNPLRLLLLLTLLLPILACGGSAATHAHGSLSRLSAGAADAAVRCEHNIPADVCTRCNPALEARFKQVGDWCPPHSRPESQCYLCHPDLSFDPLPAIPADADYAEVGDTLAAGPLEALAVPGKVTLIDFFAPWCTGCQHLETELRNLLASRTDFAIRRIVVNDWEGPVVERHLQQAATLPYLVVLSADGIVKGSISGFDREAFHAKLNALTGWSK